MNVKRDQYVSANLRRLYPAGLYYIVESCNTTQFQCTSGKCIPAGGRCDLSFDCPDSSDEINCQGVQPCPEGRHRCDTGECVTDRNLCPTTTTIKELSTSNLESSTQTPTNTFQSKSSSSFISSKYDIKPTATHSMPDSSVIDTTPLVNAVTTPTDDHDSDSENNNLLCK
ncbi:unnamed protein product [Mytilus coruscus]|uniref:LRP2 n=1 Tax=Mytilus coruscus TaxID=42192 RepID=A0A6J8DTD4_MYTCO|nr:unnamed protein product [Mytilus coruscus]